MRRGKRLIAAALCIFLLSMSFRQARMVGQLYPANSLRCQAITPEQREMIRESNAGVFPTFWGEGETRVESNLSSGRAAAVFFDGEAALACPEEYCCGRPPVMEERDACALSTGLAWELFGSENVVGLTVTEGGVSRRITGVFADTGSRILLPGGGPFTAVELSGLSGGLDGFSQGEILAAGWDLEGTLLWGPGIGALAQGLCWLPLFLAALYLVLTTLKHLFRMTSLRRSLWGFGIAFILAALLPTLLGWLPAWLLPTRWSDFGFWQHLWDRLCRGLGSLLTIAPTGRDVAAKLALGKAALFSLAACLLMKFPGSGENPML